MEDIDDDLSAKDVHLVKTCDMEIAEEYGIETYPAVVYFENGIPFLYPGMFEISSFSKFKMNEVNLCHFVCLKKYLVHKSAWGHLIKGASINCVDNQRGEKGQSNVNHAT